jgi:hypothetical protein
MVDFSTIASVVGIGVSLFGASKAADAAEDSIEGIEEAIDLRKQSGALESEAIKDTAVADIKAIRYRARVAADNAASSAISMADAIARGNQDVALEAMSADQLIGDQRTALAANGVRVDTGSSFDLVMDAVRTTKINQGRIRDNATREAREIGQQARNFAEESGLLEQTAGEIIKALPSQVKASELRTEADVVAIASQIDVAQSTATQARLSGFGNAFSSLGSLGAQNQNLSAATNANKLKAAELTSIGGTV